MITREEIGWLQWCVSLDKNPALTEQEFCEYLEAILNEIYKENESKNKN